MEGTTEGGADGGTNGRPSILLPSSESDPSRTEDNVGVLCSEGISSGSEGQISRAVTYSEPIEGSETVL